MQQVGARPRRRASTTSPGDGYFWTGLLLIFAFAMTLAAIDEAYNGADWAWFTLFVTLEIAVLGLYFWVVGCWLSWVGQSGD